MIAKAETLSLKNVIPLNIIQPGQIVTYYYSASTRGGQQNPDHTAIVHEICSLAGPLGITKNSGGGGRPGSHMYTGTHAAYNSGAPVFAIGERHLDEVAREPLPDHVHVGVIACGMPARKMGFLAAGHHHFVLPGGIGTLDEFLEVLDHIKHGNKQHFLYIWNGDGSHACYRDLMDQAIARGDMPASLRKNVVFCDDPHPMAMYRELYKRTDWQSLKLPPNRTVPPQETAFRVEMDKEIFLRRLESTLEITQNSSDPRKFSATFSENDLPIWLTNPAQTVRSVVLWGGDHHTKYTLDRRNAAQSVIQHLVNLNRSLPQEYHYRLVISANRGRLNQKIAKMTRDSGVPYVAVASIAQDAGHLINLRIPREKLIVSHDTTEVLLQSANHAIIIGNSVGALQKIAATQTVVDTRGKDLKVIAFDSQGIKDFLAARHDRGYVSPRALGTLVDARNLRDVHESMELITNRVRRTSALSKKSGRDYYWVNPDGETCRLFLRGCKSVEHQR